MDMGKFRSISLIVIFELVCFFLCNVHYVRAQRLAIKSSPYLEKGGVLTKELYVMVSDSADFSLWMRTYMPSTKVIPYTRTRNLFKVRVLDKQQQDRLLQAPHLRFVETTNRIPQPEYELGTFDFSLNAVTTAHHLYTQFNGEGLTVSVKENAFDKNDIDYIGRVYQPDIIPQPKDVHATLMATTIVGAGNTSPQGKGVAWKAFLSFSDFSNLLPDNTTTLKNAEVTVQNHSYGVQIENYYGIESYEYDRQCVDYPEILHIFSAGNSGDKSSDDGEYKNIQSFANLTGQFKMAKNIISVGGVDPLSQIALLSSRGPAYDGRVKPELVAFGDGGTSEAAAIVSGIALLAQHAYKSKHGMLPPASLVKAVLINSADDKGRPEVDYEYGYGLADALGVLQSVDEGRYFNSSIADQEEKTFSVEVPENTHKLKITLVWNDSPAAPGAAKALVNDLDLQVVDNAAMVYKPWVLNHFPHRDSLQLDAKRAEDHLNNIEQVSLQTPTPGMYTIKVKGYSIAEAPQGFSISYEFERGMEWIFPRESDALDANSTKFIRWKWSGEDVSATAEWCVAGTGLWTWIGEINMMEEHLAWNVPDINHTIQLRLRTSDDEFVSERIIVSQQHYMNIGFDCDEDALLYWQRNNVSQFMVYKLVGSFMEPIAVVTDTVYSINKNSELSSVFSMAPIVDDKVGYRSRSINYAEKSVGCYVKSFLAHKIVTDSVRLNLYLTTTNGLTSLEFERESENGFITLQTIAPINNMFYLLHDPSPIPGKNVYRVKLIRNNKQVVYSETEVVFYTRDNDLTFYPNPVKSGESLYAIINSDVVTFKIHSLQGNLLQEVTNDGQIKSIESIALSSGVYVIQAIKKSGKILMGKIVVSQ
jgi:hypothetical protein